MEEAGFSEKTLKRRTELALPPLPILGRISGEDLGQCLLRNPKGGFCEGGGAAPQCRHLGQVRKGGLPPGAPLCQGLGEPLFPPGRARLTEGRELSRKPRVRVREGLHVTVELPDEGTQRFVRAPPGPADELLDAVAVRMTSRVMLGQQDSETIAGQRTRLAFVEDDQLRVNRELMKVFADKTQTEAVQRGYLRGLKQRELFRTGLRRQGRPRLPGNGVLRGRQTRFERPPEPHPHLSGRGLSEGDEQELIERIARL